MRNHVSIHQATGCFIICKCLKHIHRYRSRASQRAIVESILANSALGKVWSTHCHTSALYLLPGVVDIHEKVPLPLAFACSSIRLVIDQSLTFSQVSLITLHNNSLGRLKLLEAIPSYAGASPRTCGQDY
jgi:hypothetical protein